MSKIKLKGGTIIDDEQEYDYSAGIQDFDDNFKNNQKWWSENPESAHSAQEKNVGALDRETGGKSTYTPLSGSWSLSDGRVSDANGIRGNSYLSPYFDRKKTEGYKISEEAREKRQNNVFSYDPDKDDLYNMYKKKYMEAGRFASDDAIAKSAARTGGLASSYATTAGALAYQDYASALSDKIPELSQLAYQKWQDEQARLLEEEEYGREKTEEEYSDWYSGRNTYLDLKEKENAQNEAAKAQITAAEDEYLSYLIAMNKAQSEGYESLSDEERKLLYMYGAYYDPSRNQVIDAAGINYDSGIRKVRENQSQDNSDISAILFKAANSEKGALSLTTNELSKLVKAGYILDGDKIRAPDGSSYSVKYSSGTKKSASGSSGTSKGTVSGTKKSSSGSSGGTGSEKKGTPGAVNVGGTGFTDRSYKEYDEISIWHMAALYNKNGGGETGRQAVNEYLEKLNVPESLKIEALKNFNNTALVKFNKTLT